MFIYALSLAILIVLVIGRRVMRYEKAMHLTFIYLLMTTIVGIFYPINSLWVNMSTWRNLYGIDNAVIVSTQLSHLIMSIGILLGYLIIRYKLTHYNFKNSEIKNEKVYTLNQSSNSYFWVSMS